MSIISVINLRHASGNKGRRQMDLMIEEYTWGLYRHNPGLEESGPGEVMKTYALQELNNNTHGSKPPVCNRDNVST